MKDQYIDGVINDLDELVEEHGYTNEEAIQLLQVSAIRSVADMIDNLRP